MADARGVLAYVGNLPCSCALAGCFANRKRNPDSPAVVVRFFERRADSTASFYGVRFVLELIEEAIIAKSRSLLRSTRIDRASALKNASRFTKRTGLAFGDPRSSEPHWWKVHPHFDPRYCIRHARYLSKVIWGRLQNDQFVPVPALEFSIPKPDGSVRQIMAFSIPDSALANLIHRTATKRNLNLFSRLSYAYRPDQNIFDAIINLTRSLSAVTK